MDELPLDADPPTTGVHPLAGLPPLVATLAVAADPVSAQVALITGVGGLCLAEAASRWAHRRVARAARGRAASVTTRSVFLAVPAVALVWAGAALLLAPRLAAVHAAGVAAGAVAMLVSGLLLLLPLPSTPTARWWSDRSTRPRRATAGHRIPDGALTSTAPLIPGGRRPTRG